MLARYWVVLSVDANQLSPFASTLIRLLFSQHSRLPEIEVVQLFKGCRPGHFVGQVKIPGVTLSSKNFKDAYFPSSVQPQPPFDPATMCVAWKEDVLVQAIKGHPSSIWALKHHYPDLFASAHFATQTGADLSRWADFVLDGSSVPPPIVPCDSYACLLLKDVDLAFEAVMHFIRHRNFPFDPVALTGEAARIAAAYQQLVLPTDEVLDAEVRPGQCLSFCLTARLP